MTRCLCGITVEHRRNRQDNESSFHSENGTLAHAVQRTSASLQWRQPDDFFHEHFCRALAVQCESSDDQTHRRNEATGRYGKCECSSAVFRPKAPHVRISRRANVSIHLPIDTRARILEISTSECQQGTARDRSATPPIKSKCRRRDHRVPIERHRGRLNTNSKRPDRSQLPTTIDSKLASSDREDLPEDPHRAAEAARPHALNGESQASRVSRVLAGRRAKFPIVDPVLGDHVRAGER